MVLAEHDLDVRAESPASSETGIQPASRRRLIPVSVLPYPLALVVVTLTYFSIDSLSPALASLRTDMGLSAAGAGLIFSLLFLGRLIGNFPAAPLLVRRGAIFTAALGGGILLVGSLLAAVSPNIEVLYVARVFQGIGISLAVNAGLRSIVTARPERGAAMTLFGVASTFGGIFGLQLGGFLTDEFDWRAVFALAGLLALVIVGLSVASGIRANASVSSAVAAPAPGSLRLGPDQREMLIPLFANFLVFANYAAWVSLPLYVADEFGISAGKTANLLFVITVTHLVAAFPMARLIRRIGSRRVLPVSLTISIIGTLLIPLAPTLTLLYIPIVIYGIGQVGAVNAGGDIVLQASHGSSAAIGTLRLSSDLGLVIGPLLAGLVADRAGFGAPFFVLPMLMVLALGLAIGNLRRGDAFDE